MVTTDRALRSFNLSYVPFWSDEDVQSDLLEISADGSGIVTTNGNRVVLYHGSGTLLWDRHVPGGNILALAYSRDGSTIVTGRDDNSVTVLDRNGNSLWSAKAGFWVTSVGVSDTGSVIVAGSMDKKLYVFDRNRNTARDVPGTRDDQISGRRCKRGWFAYRGSRWHEYLWFFLGTIQQISITATNCSNKHSANRCNEYDHVTGNHHDRCNNVPAGNAADLSTDSADHAIRHAVGSFPSSGYRCILTLEKNVRQEPADYFMNDTVTDNPFFVRTSRYRVT